MEDSASPMNDDQHKSEWPVEGLSRLADALGGAARDVGRAARAIPGVRGIQARAGTVERALLRELKRRMDKAAGAGLPPPPGAAASSPSASSPSASSPSAWSPTASSPRPRPTPPGEQQFANAAATLRGIGDTLNALLRRSMDDTPDVSRRLLHESLLRELVPDEARILSALSDGSTYPMVHVAEPGIGTYQKRLLENASSVGRAAGVALPHRTALYVTHLRRLGLVVSGDEDTSVRDEYEILLTEPTIRSVIVAISKGPRQARIIRRTIAISDLGRELWQAAQGEPSPDRAG